MLIVFDLDDTLYEELSFVRSGYKAVAAFLEPILKTERRIIYLELMEELSLGRDHVFDRVLEKYNMKSKALIKKCLGIYRGHEPKLALYPEAAACLERLQNHTLYVVTDGNKIVQKKKFIALGLDLYIKRSFYTYAHGRHRSKPSPYCFEQICRLENVEPSSVVYVADNPHKDFVGIKPLGFHTVRVLTGPYRHDRVDENYEAECQIDDLKLLDEDLLDHLRNCRGL